jgi:hypothetical protein
MRKTTPTTRPAPLRDHTLALLAARGAYVRALRRAVQAADHLALTATECRRAPKADVLLAMAATHGVTLDALLDVAE